MQRVGKACYTSLSKAKAYLKLSLEEKTKINLFSVYLACSSQCLLTGLSCSCTKGTCTCVHHRSPFRSSSSDTPSAL